MASPLALDVALHSRPLIYAVNPSRNGGVPGHGICPQGNGCLLKE